MNKWRLGLGACVVAWASAAAAWGQSSKPYRLKSTDLKQPLIWSAAVELPDGSALGFGGQDQASDDGLGHTRERRAGETSWKYIHEQLADRDSLRLAASLATWRERQRTLTARARTLFFRGELASPARGEIRREEQAILTAVNAALAGEKLASAPPFPEANSGDGLVLRELRRAAALLPRLIADLDQPLTAALIERMSQTAEAFDRAAALVDREPPPRALSPLAYHAATKTCYLFGGDHADYLLNDLWAYDVAGRRWRQIVAPSAPPPRANHTLRIDEQGRVIVAGGYTYTSSTDYCGGQYRDLNDGPWTFDPRTNQWSGGGLVDPFTRVYRTGPYVPEYFTAGEPPDAAAFAKQLADLPANTWRQTKPLRLPELNRDWGSAVLDPDRDMILRFSGGHSAHGGTDVIQFHLATGRWELCFPVEFPLGQLYTNTEYPEGFNFNRRPWVTGHTYQNYGYDPHLRRMLFTGQQRHFYIYDPERGDWTGRGGKPSGMTYNSCFYTLTTCATPQGLIVWTHEGRLFRFDASSRTFEEWKTSGAKLPGAIVDNSTIAFDAKRNRLLVVRKEYGDKATFDGQVHAIDIATKAVTPLDPRGRDAARAIPYLCQLRCDAEHDLLLVGGTLPPDATGFRRTPAFDCAGNRWISLRIGGDDPSGKAGRNVSLGMMYDPRRKLFWAVDAASRVFVLRLDPARAEVRELGE